MGMLAQLFRKNNICLFNPHTDWLRILHKLYLCIYVPLKTTQYLNTPLEETLSHLDQSAIIFSSRLLIIRHGGKCRQSDSKPSMKCVIIIILSQLANEYP